MKQKIVGLIRYLVFASFLAPLVVMPNSFIFPFIVPKVLFLRTLILFMIGLYCILLAINWQEFRPRFNLVSVSVLAFLLSFLVSSVLGVDFYHSLWDNQERMLGLFTIIHYTALFFIAQVVFKNWQDWRRVLLIFLASGSVVMLIGCYQKIDPFFLLNQGSDRVASTLGNAIYVGGLGLFLFFISLLLFLKETSPRWRVLQALGGLLALLGMIFSGTRGSLLGLLVSLLVIILGYSLLLKNQQKVRIGLGILFGAIVLGVGFLYINRQALWVQNIPAVGRLVSSTLSGGGISTRIIAWKIAIVAWREHVAFGWGPNNYFYAFNKYYDPQSLEHSYTETWFDNAHNIILNTLTTQGLVGLIIYLSLFGVVILSLWKNKELRQDDCHTVIILSAFFVAHLIQNITVFENPTSYLYFFLSLAFVSSILSSLKKAKIQVQPQALDKKINVVTVGVVGLLTLVMIYLSDIQPAKANAQTFVAMAYISQNLEYGLPYMKAAMGFTSPHIDDIRSDLARTAIQTLAGEYSRLPRVVVTDVLTTAREALEKNLILHPLDIRLHLYLAQLHQLDFSVNKNPASLVAGEQILEQGLILSPRRQQFVYALANFKLQLNKSAEAVALVKQSIEDDRKIPEGYWRLAYTYYMMHNLAEAQAVLSLAVKRGVSFDNDDQGQKIIALILGQSAASSSKQ